MSALGGNSTKEELKQEIDYNLMERDDLKDFLGRFKKNGGSVKDLDSEFIAMKFGGMEASYDDIAFYIAKLYNDGFFTQEEAKYVAGRMEEPDFYEDSDDLKVAIAEKEEWLKSNSSDETLSQIAAKCADKYEYYIHERAAYNLNYFIEN